MQREGITSLSHPDLVLLAGALNRKKAPKLGLGLCDLALTPDLFAPRGSEVRLQGYRHIITSENKPFSTAASFKIFLKDKYAGIFLLIVLIFLAIFTL